MKSNKFLVVIIVMALTIASCLSLAAKDKKVSKIYAFGMAASFNDSIVYFTNIQEIDSVWINEKNNFLVNRSDYSYQLKNHLEANGLSRRTCVISYALKRKDIEKKYEKMKSKYKKKGSFDIRFIDDNEFKFTPIELDE